MTQQEFVKKLSRMEGKLLFGLAEESESMLIAKEEFKNGYFNGLTKGLEIAEGFASWAITEFTKAAIGKDSVFRDDKDINDAELLEIYLTEINEKR